MPAKTFKDHVFAVNGESNSSPLVIAWAPLAQHDAKPMARLLPNGVWLTECFGPDKVCQWPKYPRVRLDAPKNAIVPAPPKLSRYRKGKVKEYLKRVKTPM